MTDEQQWIRLYKYLDKRFGAVDKQFNEIKADFRKQQDSVHGIAARQDDDDIERKAMTAQLDRHDGWIHTLAAKTDTKLEY